MKRRTFLSAAAAAVTTALMTPEELYENERQALDYLRTRDGHLVKINRNFNPNNDYTVEWWQRKEQIAGVEFVADSLDMDMPDIVPRDNKWHHACMVKQGNRREFYLDGERVV